MKKTGGVNTTLPVFFNPIFMKKRILITGGAGFIGSHLCKRLLDEGNEVLCLDNYFTGNKENILPLIQHPYFEVIRHADAYPELQRSQMRLRQFAILIEELQAYFTYDPARDVIVSGHRGGMMPGYPENCIESCEKTLSMMPTFFEIDFSFTKDSVMVLMHDLTIDRTTNGKGRVADYTYEELQGFRLVDRDGKLTPYRIPRLKDMLEWGKDKVVFNFDNKYINTKGVSDEVRKASLDYYIRQLRPGGDWSMYHNIMLSVRSLDEAMYYWNAGIRNVMFCCEISSREMFDAYDACPIPWDYIMAYIRLSVDPRLQEVYDLLHERGVSTMTSITGSSDKVKNPRDRRVCYLRDLVSEPDLIETDYPSEFVDLPRSRAEIHALQDRAIEGNRSVKADKAKKNRRK